MGLANMINKSIENKLGQLNTLTICNVVQVIPHIELLTIYDTSYSDGDIMTTTKIQEPITMKGDTFEVGDKVLVGFLQEVVEDGFTRKFDISDAVIIGKVEL